MTSNGEQVVDVFVSEINASVNFVRDLKTKLQLDFAITLATAKESWNKANERIEELEQERISRKEAMKEEENDDEETQNLLALRQMYDDMVIAEDDMLAAAAASSNKEKE